jgi:hypothetical protein
VWPVSETQDTDMADAVAENFFRMSAEKKSSVLTALIATSCQMSPDPHVTLALINEGAREVLEQLLLLTTPPAGNA